MLKLFLKNLGELLYVVIKSGVGCPHVLRVESDALAARFYCGEKVVGLPRLELGACPHVLRAESDALALVLYRRVKWWAFPDLNWGPARTY